MIDEPKQVPRGIAQIAQGEGVHHVEALRSELLALNHDRVKVAEAEEDGAHLGVNLIDVLGREGAEGALEVLL